MTLRSRRRTDLLTQPLDVGVLDPLGPVLQALDVQRESRCALLCQVHDAVAEESPGSHQFSVFVCVDSVCTTYRAFQVFGDQGTLLILSLLGMSYNTIDSDAMSNPWFLVGDSSTS